jgi:diacylglycerol diphosphate phosphatase / phosphatidate phosphatase
VWGLSNYTICTQPDEHILRDGFRSFPSGHASLSFAGLGFLSFYLAGKLRLWDDHGYAVSPLLLARGVFDYLHLQAKVWLALTPLTGASLVAITRTMDYRR